MVVFPLRAKRVWSILAVADVRTVCFKSGQSRKSVKWCPNSFEPAGSNEFVKPAVQEEALAPTAPSTGNPINVSLPNSGFSGPTGRLTHCWHDGLCARSTQVWFLSRSPPKQANSGSNMQSRPGSDLPDGPELVPGLD